MSEPVDKSCWTCDVVDEYEASLRRDRAKDVLRYDVRPFNGKWNIHTDEFGAPALCDECCGVVTGIVTVRGDDEPSPGSKVSERRTFTPILGRYQRCPRRRRREVAYRTSALGHQVISSRMKNRPG